MVYASDLKCHIQIEYLISRGRQVPLRDWVAKLQTVVGNQEHCVIPVLFLSNI